MDFVKPRGGSSVRGPGGCRCWCRASRDVLLPEQLAGGRAESLEVPGEELRSALQNGSSGAPSGRLYSLKIQNTTSCNSGAYRCTLEDPETQRNLSGTVILKVTGEVISFRNAGARSWVPLNWSFNFASVGSPLWLKATSCCKDVNFLCFPFTISFFLFLHGQIYPSLTGVDARCSQTSKSSCGFFIDKPLGAHRKYASLIVGRQRNCVVPNRSDNCLIFCSLGAF